MAIWDDNHCNDNDPVNEYDDDGNEIDADIAV
jgi:hypothetical protein